MGMRTYKITVAVAGTAGSATGSQDSSKPINGELYGIYLDYTSQPVTTDVTITTTNPTQTLLVRSNSGTDGWFYPRATICDASAGALLFYEEFPLDAYINVAVAQGDPGSVDVYLLVDE